MCIQDDSEEKCDNYFIISEGLYLEDEVMVRVVPKVGQETMGLN